MMNLFSYVIFSLGNFLFIFFIPDFKVQNFLYIYSLSSLIIGPLSFIFFSNFLKKKKLIKLVILILNLALVFNYNKIGYLFFVYTLNIFFCDLFSSQMKSEKINFLFKSTLFLSIFPLIFSDYVFESILILRVIFCVFLIIYLFLIQEKYSKLQIKNPFSYQIFTNVNYFGSLFILSMILGEYSLKITYILFQVGFAIILKFYDLRIRNIISYHQFNTNLRYIIFICFSISLIFLYIKSSLTIFVLYYLSLIFFILMRYRFLNYEKN